MKTRVMVTSLVVVLMLALLWGVAGKTAASPRQPRERIEPLGVTYENCTPEQQAALQNALAGIHDKKTDSCKDKIGADLLKCLMRKEGDIQIKCGGGPCDKNNRVEGAAPLGGDYVWICRRTFGSPQRLEAVLFHELVHSCGKDDQDKVAEACQNACYASEGATPPDAGEEGGSCNGAGSAPMTAHGPRIAPQNSNLTGTLTADRQMYAYGEPLTITFRLQNISASGTITVNQSWYNPNFNSLGIFDSQGQQRRSLILWETRPPDATNFAVLAPGDVFSDTFAVTAAYYGTLPPGLYTLTVTYTNWYTGHFTPSYPYPFVGDLGAWTGTLRTNDLHVFIYLQRVYLPVVMRDYAP